MDQICFGSQRGYVKILKKVGKMAVTVIKTREKKNNNPPKFTLIYA